MFRLRAPLLIAGLGLADIAPLPAQVQAPAQQSNAALAEDLENPIYRRLTIPLQNNYDCCFVNTPGQGGHWGIGDTTQAFYFGRESGTTFYYGGPIFLIPSEDPQISGGQWAAGPTLAIGGQSGPWDGVRFTATWVLPK